MSVLTTIINNSLKKLPVLLVLLMTFPAVSSAANRVSGVVYGGNTPLANVEVTIRADGSDSSHGYKMTGTDGRFSFLINDGNYHLRSISQIDSGYGSANVNGIVVNGTDQVIDVYLLPGGINLTGTVYQNDGVTPASNIELKIFDSNQPDSYIDTVVTNAQGQYLFTVAAGTYGLAMKTVNSVSNGLNFHHTKYLNNIALAENTTQDITLPFISVSGKTLDSRGQRVGNVEINLTDLNQTMTDGAEVFQQVNTIVSDANGDYSVTLYPFSDYEVTLIPPVDAIGPVITSLKNIDISAQTTALDFNLQNGSVLSGKVYLPKENTPAKDVVLKIYEVSDPTAYLKSVVTDSTGKYAFSVPAGSYGLYMEVLESSNAGLIGKFISSKHIDNIQVSRNVDIDILLPFITISGSTVDANGVAVAGVKVNLESTNLAATNSGYTIQYGGTVTSDSAGDYAFSVYPHTDYNISLLPSAAVSNSVTTLNNLDLSVSRFNYDLQFKAGYQLNGTVFLADGSTPASQVELKLFDTANPGVYLDTVITDNTGAYSFSVNSGSYGLYMKVLKTGNANILNDLLSSKFLDNIELTANLTQNVILPLVQISGKTVNGFGVAVAGVEIQIEDLSVAGVNGGQVYQSGSTLMSDANGQFIISTYPDNHYALSVSPPAGSGFATLSYNNIDFTVSKSQAFVLPFEDIIPPLVITSPRPKYLTDTTVFIEWVTDEPCTSMVAVNGVPTEIDQSYKTHHSVALTGLTPSTYYSDVYVFSTDKAGFDLVDAYRRTAFFTKATPDTTLPVITSGPTVAAITDTTALIRWSTSEPTNSQVFYGQSSLSTSLSDASFKVEHEIELTGLTPLTNYILQVQATDFNNNGPVSSSTIDFSTIATPDTTAPVIISGPFVSNVTDTSVTIILDTDEPASSVISYNDGTAYNIYDSAEFNTHHEIIIGGLTPATLYNFVASLTDQVGNGPTLSTTNSFSTLTTADILPPVITEPLKVVGVTHRSAVIIWSTDEPSDSLIEYGLSADALTLTQSKPRLQTDHQIQLVNLSANTEYFFKATSTDIDGNVMTTELLSVTTRGHHDVRGPRFTRTPRVIAVNNSACTIAWETDEPSDSTIKYGQGNSITHRRSSDHKTQHHQISITGLSQNEIYSFEVESTDSEGNRSTHNQHDNSASATTERTNAFFIKTANAELGSTSGITTDAVADTTAPDIVIQPELVAVAANYAIIRWQTGESSNAVIQYGHSGGTLDHLKAELEYASDHLIVVTNLLSSSSYDLRVIASDLAANKSNSQLLSFTTATGMDTVQPDIITNVGFTVVSETEMEATMTTNEYTSASMICTDSIDNSVYQVSSQGLNKAHTLYQSGLNPDSDYSCIITVEDIAGNETNSGPQTYSRTLATGSTTNDSSVIADTSLNTNPSGVQSSNTTNQASNGGAISPWYLMMSLLILSLFRKQRKK
ncbi:MAG: hypothetical protein OEY36_07510 [Gammaproteobacteria bacterium]|nr:hypothetical protein [Gammaproteobacteria bacterium]